MAIEELHCLIDWIGLRQPWQLCSVIGTGLGAVQAMFVRMELAY